MNFQADDGFVLHQLASLQHRALAMIVGHLLVGDTGADQGRLVKGAPDQLAADRQAVSIQAAGDRQAGKPVRLAATV